MYKSRLIALLLFTLLLINKSNYASNLNVSYFDFKYSDTVTNPLAEFDTEWTNSAYDNCNTAKSITYLTQEEKDIIWVLNMARLNPQLFLKSLLLNPNSGFFKNVADRNNYDKSLIQTLKLMKPVTSFLQPDQSCYESAQCHAYYSGKKGYVGHNRINSKCKKDFYGECCQYGASSSVDIIMDLLLDYGVPSYGHRDICLSEEYHFIGSSIQPHSTYEYNTVIDFK